MTQDEIHAAIVKIADALDEHHVVISADHPRDHEGFPVIEDQDLADAARAIAEAVSALSRLTFRMAREGGTP
jgi:hypothetical protein